MIGSLKGLTRGTETLDKGCREAYKEVQIEFIGKRDRKVLGVCLN